MKPYSKEDKQGEALLVAQVPDRFRRMSCGCAVLVAGIGGTALLGWFLDMPFLASLGSGMIPVAPSTALLFVFYAVAVFLRSCFPLRHGPYWAGLIINSAGAVIALLLLILSYQGIRLNAEHLGFAIVHSAGEIPSGHMSPLTALCFLLAALSFLASLRSSPGRSRWTTVAWWLACFLFAISIVLILAYMYGVPLLYGSSFIPPALPTSIAFMIMSIALLCLAAPHSWLSRQQAASPATALHTFILVFLLLAAGIVTAGFLYHRKVENRHRVEVENQLKAITDLKTSEIVQWRKERLADAAVFYGNFNFARRVRSYFKRPDAETRERLKIWLDGIQKASQYDRLFLLDDRGRVRISVPEEGTPISNQVLAHAVKTFQVKQVDLPDFYRNEHDGHVYLSVLVPVRESDDEGHAVGVLVMRIDPEQYLYPQIIRWPTPSKTAETLLVRKEGNEVLFLNELRFQKHTALRLRYPLDQKELPAAQAVLGRTGIMEGRDYRGVPVIADLRAVPDSPWFLVTRMDLSEVYAPLRERLWMMVALIGALLTGSGAIVGLVWRQQNTVFLQEKYKVSEALRESEESFRLLIEGVKDYAIFILDPFGHVLSWNQGAERIKGYQADEIIGRDFSCFYPQEEIENRSPQRDLQRAMRQGSFENEGWRVRKDGSRFWANVVITALKDESGNLRGFSKVTRDITEQRRAAEEVQRLNAELEQRVLDRTAQLEAANKELEGFSYSVSHDLRAPLRHITGFAEMLIKKAPAALDEKSRHYLNVISDAARQMGKLVDDLLSFSRMGRAEMLQATLNLDKIVTEVVEACKKETEGRDIVWTVGSLPDAYGDKVMLKIVFENLLSNAIKFTRTMPRAMIEIGCIADQPNELICYVRDNGVGFDMKYVDKLFGLFQRLHRPDEFEGTGLGLANVRRIIHRHGGRTWAEGKVNDGAVIYFSLPKIKEA